MGFIPFNGSGDLVSPLRSIPNQVKGRQQCHAVCQFAAYANDMLISRTAGFDAIKFD